MTPRVSLKASGRGPPPLETERPSSSLAKLHAALKLACAQTKKHIIDGVHCIGARIRPAAIALSNYIAKLNKQHAGPRQHRKTQPQNASKTQAIK